MVCRQRISSGSFLSREIDRNPKKNPETTNPKIIVFFFKNLNKIQVMVALTPTDLRKLVSFPKYGHPSKKIQISWISNHNLIFWYQIIIGYILIFWLDGDHWAHRTIVCQQQRKGKKDISSKMFKYFCFLLKDFLSLISFQNFRFIGANGITVSADGNTVYVNDPADKRITVMARDRVIVFLYSLKYSKVSNWEI